ncbi:MAG: sulfate ABC transporter substrate-binding protein [Chloroflexota bacterium]
MKRIFKVLVAIGLLTVLAVVPAAAQDTNSVTITLAGYTVIQATYAKILPLFADYWKQQTGQDVTFQESYLASGAQSRAVAGGFEADVVALSLEGDVKRVADAGLITHDWKDNPYGGIISDSLVVLVTRKDNPKNILDWNDLAQPGIEVITPDAATSGGAQWNVMAAYGAAFRGQVKGYDAGADGARKFLADLFTNVSVMDASGLDSYQTFERGVGDVSITYENQYFAGKALGDDFTVIYPTSTIVIENPIALVDTYVDKHGNRDATQAFVDFLYRPEIQAIFAADGFRPPMLKTAGEATPEATAEVAAEAVTFPQVPDAFTIDDFGGWSQVKTDIFGDDGVYTQVIAEVKGG